jgi:alpha-galactosidase
MLIAKRTLSAALLAFVACSPRAYCQNTATIRTRQTILKLQAEDQAPRLLSVGTGSGESWQNTAPEKLIDSVFIDGRAIPVHWVLNRHAANVNGRRVAFVYECRAPQLRLVWEWKALDSSGPIEHSIHIQNLEAKEVWIPIQDSFSFELPISAAVGLQHFYAEKGAGSPSDDGTHLTPVPVGYHWAGKSSTYAHPANGEAREVIPFLAIEKAGGESNGWYAGVEFSGRTRLTVERSPTSLSGVIGLNPDPGPFRSRLKPHESFDTPTVFVGAFTGDIDGLGNVLRPWVRRVLGNPSTWQNLHYPFLTNNSWGGGMQVDEALALKMIRDSAELGVEMFHVDAGWFRGVGDWYPDPKKFPHGLAGIANKAHQEGLKFGIWTDWTQAALDTHPGALNLRDPKVQNWTVSDVPADWKPQPFKGQTIDIGVEEAHSYAKREVSRLVEAYNLDMLEHDGYLVTQGCVRRDHPHAAPDPARTSVETVDGSYIVLSSNSTDVSYHAVRAYYDIYADLRRRHPNLLLEICNDGGRMVDFGSAAHGDYFSITDGYDPLSNRRAFYDASHLLPAAMLESYVEKWPTPKIENFRYMLRSGMQGWLTIMLDTNAWSEQQHAVAKAEIQLYKKELRNLIRDADIYHIAPRPDGVHWDGTEFFDPSRGQGVVYAFRGSSTSEERHTYKIRGVATDKPYRLRFQDHSASDRVVMGRDLLTTGLVVKLPVPNSSELIFIDAPHNSVNTKQAD